MASRSQGSSFKRNKRTLYKMRKGVAQRANPIDLLLMSEGIDSSIVAKTEEQLRTEFAPITGGHSYSPGRNSLPDSLNLLKELEGALYLGGGGLGVVLANRKIQDKFQFETSPAMRALSQAGSTYAEIIGSALETAERERLGWGQRVGNALVTGYRAYEIIRALQRVPELMKWFKRGADVVRAGRAARAGAVAVGGGAAAAGTGGTSLAAAAAIIAIDFLVTEALIAIGNLIGKTYSRGYVYENVRHTVAAQLLNKERPISEFASFAGVLTGTEFHGDRGFDLMKNIRNVEAFGGRVSNFGYDYGALGDIVSNIRTSTSYSDFEGMAGHASLASQMFGVSENQVIPAYATLSRITPEADIATVSEQFINFFAAMSGDGSLITSQLGLVNYLTEFSESYGYATKFNENSADELAKATAYLSASEIVQLQTPELVTSTISTLDEILLAGGTYGNARANELLAMAGISNAEAIHGITGDADILPKLLGAMTSKLGLSEGDFDENGLTDAGYYKLFPYLTEGLGMSTDSVQPIAVALDAYRRGMSEKDIEAAYRKARDTASRGASISSPILTAMQQISDQEIALSDIMRDNILVTMDMAEAMRVMTYEVQNAVIVTGDFVRTVGKLLGVDFPPKRPLPAGTVTGRRWSAPRYTASASNISEFRSNVTHSHRITNEYISAVLWGASELGVNPLELHALIGFETAYTYRTDIKSSVSSATGYIQFLESTARGLGTTTKDLAAMSPEEQMAFVVKYLRRWGIGAGSTVGDMYMAIFAPAHINKPDNYVVYSGEAAAKNPALDLDGDGEITKYEILSKVYDQDTGMIARALTGVEWNPPPVHDGSVTINANVGYVSNLPLIAQILAGTIMDSIIQKLER